MGEITDMILDGELCEVCGVHLEDSEERPYPHKCEGCKYE